MVPNVRLAEVGVGGSFFQGTFGGETADLDGVEAVIVDDFPRSSMALQDKPFACRVRLHVIGDCLASRTAEDAVHHGLEVASGPKTFRTRSCGAAQEVP